MAGYIGSGASVVSSGAERKKVFDITTNTTSLTGLNYTVGKVHVYHNGVRLVDGTDYTATNSTSITLTVAAVSGDQVVVVSYASYQVALSGIDDQSNAVALTIDSSENVLVGKTATNYQTNGVEAKPDGSLWATATNNGPLVATRKSSDGNIASFYKDSNFVGSIGVEGDDLTIGTGTNSGLQFFDGGSSVRPFNMASNSRVDNAIDLGESNTRFKDLYLSGGVYLGGTGSANKLDDYEEGTWTPSFSQAPAGTVSSLAGQYVKVGKLVTVYCQVTGSNLNITNYVRLVGLPFSASDKNATGTYIIGGITNRIHGWTTLASGTNNWYWSISGSTSASSIVASVTYKI